MTLQDLNQCSGSTGSRDKYLKLWAVQEESDAINTVPLRSRLEEVLHSVLDALFK